VSTSSSYRINYIEIFHPLATYYDYLQLPLRTAVGWINFRHVQPRAPVFESISFHLLLSAADWSTIDGDRREWQCSELNDIRLLAQVQKMALLGAGPSPSSVEKKIITVDVVQSHYV
jgi:hypothetical protein